MILIDLANEKGRCKLAVPFFICGQLVVGLEEFREV